VKIGSDFADSFRTAFTRGWVDKGNGTRFMVRNGNNLNKKMPTKAGF
jgi:hypothetical protein